MQTARARLSYIQFTGEELNSRTVEMLLLVLQVVCSLLVGYVLLKVFQLCRADGDLTVMGSTMKPEYYQGRVVWVTGASSGIGEAMCYQLSQMGAKLILSARNKEKLEEVRRILAHPNNARVLPVDLSDPEASRSVSRKAKDLFGKIDILVNNAGVSCGDWFMNIQEHVHRRVMEVNFFATWILTHDLIKDMIREDFGHVVNISSVLGKHGSHGFSTYCSAKFGTIGFMDCVRQELYGCNVYVTNILPGPICTNISKNSLMADGTPYGETIEFIANGMPAKRCAELCLIGISNQQKEVWISQHPSLLGPYLAHYCPSLLHYFMVKDASCDSELKKAINSVKKED